MLMLVVVSKVYTKLLQGLAFSAFSVMSVICVRVVMLLVCCSVVCKELEQPSQSIPSP